MHVVIAKDMLLPAAKYGGTERVMWALGRQLVLLGHQVTFLVRRGSSCPFAKVLWINLDLPIECQIPEDADIVHFNDRVSERDVDKPYIVTINGNMQAGDAVAPNAVFVSSNHARRHGSDSYVYNALDWEDYGDADLSRRRQHYHFLGKAAWKVKNVRGAIRLVKQLPGGELDVLGGSRFNFKMGMRFTFSPRIHFHGMVDNWQKQYVIERSRGLVFPVLWDEPFGLCLIESLYYGAPVFGTCRGSLPEIITPDVGFLSDDEDELVSHLMAASDYSPQLCHDYVVEKFSAKVMALEYLKRYEQVLNGKSLNDGHAI